MITLDDVSPNEYAALSKKIAEICTSLHMIGGEERGVAGNLQAIQLIEVKRCGNIHDLSIKILIPETMKFGPGALVQEFTTPREFINMILDSLGVFPERNKARMIRRA